MFNQKALTTPIFNCYDFTTLYISGVSLQNHIKCICYMHKYLFKKSKNFGCYVTAKNPLDRGGFSKLRL